MTLMILGLAGAGALLAAGAETLVDENVVFEERDGVVAVEAEHFFRQTDTDVRKWYIVKEGDEIEVSPDGDPNHAKSASNGIYLEALPDTRRSHDDKLISGENFINVPGKMAVLSYKVHFNTAGRYYVWARIYSTTTEDNGLHVGLDGKWPESGQRMQWTAKDHWAWGSKQRTEEVHIGLPGILYLDVDKPGLHTITFSMREDGFEFDKWLMTTEQNMANPGFGPVERRR
jgi:Gylcosyl hydrolase family 115 C-terminal domain